MKLTYSVDMWPHYAEHILAPPKVREIQLLTDWIHLQLTRLTCSQKSNHTSEFRFLCWDISQNTHLHPEWPASSLSLHNPNMTERSIYRATNLLYTQEKISRYRPGGYHPVCIDDNLKDSRYKICHKLGYGGFSTVWLARDKMYVILGTLVHRFALLTCHRLNRWVSIKVTITGSAKASRELQNIRSIMEHTKNKPGSQSISQLLDIFVHHGPNGAHCCLVFELLGPTLATVLQPYYKDNRHLRPETVFKISKQLLRAIALIHQVGYAHGGMCPSTIPLFAYSIHCLNSQVLLGFSFADWSRFEHQQCGLFVSQAVPNNRGGRPPRSHRGPVRRRISSSWWQATRKRGAHTNYRDSWLGKLARWKWRRPADTWLWGIFPSGSWASRVSSANKSESARNHLHRSLRL